MNADGHGCKERKPRVLLPLLPAFLEDVTDIWLIGTAILAGFALGLAFGILITGG